MNTRRLTAYASFLLISAIWGWAGPVIKFTLQTIPPLIFLEYRFFLATLIALAYFAIKRPKWPKATKDQWAILIISILAVPIGLGFLFVAFDKTSSLSASIISCLSPIMTILAGWFFLHDHITKREKFGYAVAACGFLLIVIQPLLGNGHSTPLSLIGNLLMLVHLIADTAANTVAKVALRDRVPATAMAQIGFVIGFVICLPLVLFFHSPQEISTTLLQAPWQAHLGVLYMVVFSGAIAYAMKYHAMRSIELSETAVFGYLLPVWAAPLSILWLGESFSPLLLVGACITAVGVVIAEIKSKKRK